MHLGGQLPPEGIEDSARSLQEILPESDAKPVTHSQSNDSKVDSRKSPSVSSPSEIPILNSNPPALVTGSTKTADSTLQNPSMSKSCSPDLIQSLDSFTNPTTQSSTPVNVDPLALCVSDPTSSSKQTDQVSPANKVHQVEQVDTDIQKPTLSPSSSTDMKITIMSMELDDGDDELSASVNAFLGSSLRLDNIENNQESDVIGGSETAPSCPNPSSSLCSDDPNVDETQTVESLSVFSKPQSPEPMEEDKNCSPPPTPKQDQAAVSEEDPKKTCNVGATDTADTETRAPLQRAASFVRETRQSFHFGSYRREDQSRLASSESLESAISLAPTLPSPISRPEKKTYCCAECGKEYASRSGLKVRETFMKNGISS